MASAFFWALLAASSLVLGGLLASWVPLGKRTLGVILAFGAGVLLSATAYELVFEAVTLAKGSGFPALGFFGGAATFFLADQLIDRLGNGQANTDNASKQSTLVVPLVLGATLDGIPESVVIGLGLVGGGTVSLAMLVAVFISNLPEAAPACAQAKGGKAIPGDAKAKQAYAMGVQAYIWGYPMVVMQRSRDAMTKGGDAPVTPEQFEKSGKLFAPVNQIASAWGMLGPKFSAVQSGNTDTLYSVTWFDTSEEPQVLHLPDAKGRYYTYQFIDAWTNNFHYASTRTMGSQEQTYALVAPGWKGKLPDGVTRVDCPTPTGFIIGRWFVASQKDVAAVNAIQKQVTMTPMNRYEKPYTPPKVPVVAAKKYTGDLAFFEQLGDTLVVNGAPAADAGLLGLFKNIGLTVDHGFDPSALSDGEKKALRQAIEDGAAVLAAKAAAMGREVNGWQLSPVLDAYFGDSYLFRAAIGYQAMFVNTPIEAYYPAVFKDTDGEVLDGSSGKYTITFPKGKTPPVGAFWSVTLYDAKKRLMVENPIKRYKIGSADEIKAGSDGSTTIYIQAASPGKDKESNWLPAPKEPFYLLLRMYLPKIEVLNGQYEIPGVDVIRER